MIFISQGQNGDILTSGEDDICIVLLFVCGAGDQLTRANLKWYMQMLTKLKMSVKRGYRDQILCEKLLEKILYNKDYLFFILVKSCQQELL